MTYFPSCFTTEGLNVPADSNPSPRGDKIGSRESRVHFPKRGVNGTAATAAKAMRTSRKFLLCGNGQTIIRSEFGQQLNERPSRDLQRLADALAIYAQTNGSLSRSRNSDRCSSGNGRWVVQDEIQLS